MLSKSVFFTKSAIPFLLAKFACLSLAVKFSDVSLLNFGVVIYLSWSWSAIFFSSSLIFELQSLFLTKLLTLGILLSTTLRETLVAKLVILGISPLTSFILALRVVLVAKFVILGILYSIFYVSITYIFFNNIIFLLYYLVYLNQQEQVLIYQHLVYLLYFPNCSN